MGIFKYAFTATGKSTISKKYSNVIDMESTKYKYLNSNIENEKETFFLIHVLQINSERYNNLIKFRDILNNNKNILKQYEKLKIDLAKKYNNDRKKYTESKN